MTTPYTTSAGLRIGSAYTPPPPKMSADAEAIQQLLLEQRRRERDARTTDAGHGAMIVFAVVCMSVWAVFALIGRAS